MKNLNQQEQRSSTLWKTLARMAREQVSKKDTIFHKWTGLLSRELETFLFNL